MKGNRSILPRKLFVQILLIIVTLVAVGVAIVTFLRHHEQQQRENNRKATQYAELGLQKALEKFHRNPQWRAGIDTTETENGWYKVDLSRYTEEGTKYVTIESFGHAGTILKSKSWTLRRTTNNEDTVWVRYLVE